MKLIGEKIVFGPQEKESEREGRANALVVGNEISAMSCVR